MIKIFILVLAMTGFIFLGTTQSTTHKNEKHEMFDAISKATHSGKKKIS